MIEEIIKFYFISTIIGTILFGGIDFLTSKHGWGYSIPKYPKIEKTYSVFFLITFINFIIGFIYDKLFSV